MTTQTKYRWLIVDEDGTPRGTNNKECADAHANNNCATLVVDLETLAMRFENQDVGPMEVQPYNPEDWKEEQ